VSRNYTSLAFSRESSRSLIKTESVQGKPD